MTWTPKPQWEEKIFREFCRAADIKLDEESVRHGNERDEPDILCTVDGQPASFELAEIVDEGLAAGTMKAIKTGEITGGAYGYDRPLLRTTVNHLVKCYSGAVGPLSLLLYFDKQYPPPKDWGVIEGVLGDVVMAALEPKRWKAVWVFCTSQQEVLVRWPPQA